MSTDKKQAVMEHVLALRRVIIVSIAAVAVLFLLLIPVYITPVIRVEKAAKKLAGAR